MRKRTKKLLIIVGAAVTVLLMILPPIATVFQHMGPPPGSNFEYILVFPLPLSSNFKLQFDKLMERLVGRKPLYIDGLCPAVAALYGKLWGLLHEYLYNASVRRPLAPILLAVDPRSGGVYAVAVLPVPTNIGVIAENALAARKVFLVDAQLDVGVAIGGGNATLLSHLLRMCPAWYVHPANDTLAAFCSNCSRLEVGLANYSVLCLGPSSGFVIPLTVSRNLTLYALRVAPLIVFEVPRVTKAGGFYNISIGVNGSIALIPVSQKVSERLSALCRRVVGGVAAPK